MSAPSEPAEFTENYMRHLSRHPLYGTWRGMINRRGTFRRWD
jgi:hypothetical protein